jgi:LPXTG-motif cell wall-anchored protein
MDLSMIITGVLAALFGGLYFVRRKSRMKSDAWE